MFPSSQLNTNFTLHNYSVANSRLCIYMYTVIHVYSRLCIYMYTVGYMCIHVYSRLYVYTCIQ